MVDGSGARQGAEGILAVEVPWPAGTWLLYW